LFKEEAVDGQILIKCPNHIVPIHPRILRGHVPFVAVSIGVMHDVEPVPGPVFTEMRTVEDGCHIILVGVC
jgi:hypothetical protein